MTMQEAISSLKARWRAGQTTTNCWLAIPDALVGEIAARAGFDSLCIDMQHGLADQAAATRILQATSGSGVPVMARVPWNDPGIIMRMLDAGAAGVIVPLINTRQDAEAAVSACRYPPVGSRSYGPIRPGITEGPGYFAGANDSLLVFAMIETKQALDNLEDILATPGLDGIYIGPADLSLALGLPPEQDSKREEHQATVKSIFAAAKRHGKVAGLHCASAEFAAMACGWGADFVTIVADTLALRQELVRRVSVYKELAAS
ncbi:MAG: hypothetical protein KF813_01950 [Trueperaceae bacterium]|nr:hypothetical protein [Trueperaceae bacterium]